MQYPSGMSTPSYYTQKYPATTPRPYITKAPSSSFSISTTPSYITKLPEYSTRKIDTSVTAYKQDIQGECTKPKFWHCTTVRYQISKCTHWKKTLIYTIQSST